MDQDWFEAQARALAAVFGPNNIDPFPKLLAQAFAEASVGDVYVFAPEGLDLENPFPDARYKAAWVGWEYPALTRSGALTRSTG